MCFSYRILALIYNAGPWLFFLKVWSRRGFHHKALFSVANCLLQMSPLEASRFVWKGGQRPRASLPSTRSSPGFGNLGMCRVSLLAASRQETGAVAVCLSVIPGVTHPPAAAVSACCVTDVHVTGTPVGVATINHNSSMGAVTVHCINNLCIKAPGQASAHNGPLWLQMSLYKFRSIT